MTNYFQLKVMKMRIKQSCFLLFLMAGGALMVVQPTIVVGSSDNLLVDANFENWTNSTMLTNWTWSDPGDNNITQETSMVLSGNSSVKLTKGSVSLASLSQYVDVALKNHALSVWVYDNNPNARVTITLDGGTGAFDSNTSVDNASWQQLTVTVNSGNSLNPWLGVSISILGQGSTPGGLCYIDAAALIEGTSPMPLTPEITIKSPNNSTHSHSNTWLNFSINAPTSWIGYSLDGAPNVTITGNTVLYSLSGGSHVVRICANNSVGNVGIATRWFTVDTDFTFLTLHSPANATYMADSVWLSITLNESTSWIGYSLDGSTNVTITGNILLQGLSEGPHSIMVYANDSINNSNVAIMRFTIELPSTATTTTTATTTPANTTTTSSPTPPSTVITVISVIYETTWVTQTTTNFPILTIFAGIAGIFLFKRKRGKKY